jgi:hypothetical protein
MLSQVLEDVLSSNIETTGRPFGPEGAVGKIGTDLRRVLDKSRIFQYVAGAMCVALFVVYLILVVLHHDDTIKLGAFSSVFGISIAGLITVMMRMADQQVQSGMLLSLISCLPQDEVLPAFKALLDHERKAKNSTTRKSSVQGG